ncbi:polysaccharide biosynthesis/export family protein [Kaistella jeonii]|uniref:Sugar transporter n=1 Tax=Kaistella jeonii TaxID=266749 RepID=A0A0C1FMK4_9FLAO|nr:polysaccharide biosynthesis/export family protein [Kaistella jeonii]KIA89164.1 sugar transporter [Kaistella jeonii]SFB93685.1 polysaccharide export outer membrane protein [Kaistella jeonii]VEI97055.1 polysaccharide export protein Wza [Kaistella jeonii]
MNKNIFLLILGVLFFLSSCKTKEKTSELNYMQNVEQIAYEASINNSVSTIQKGDQLLIFVSAKDMDVVKPFNQTYYSSQNSITNSASTPSSAEKTYIVNPEGTIDFPILGVIQISGKTLEMVKSELTERVSAYVKKPTVTVKLSNFRITVLGEVDKPGQYYVSEGQGTLLNALGLAGDLTIYGKRDDILVIRNENGKIMKEHVNLKDANFINSPFYELKQGDVIYVSANRTQDKASRLDPSMPIYISVAGIVVTILALVFKK